MRPDFFDYVPDMAEGYSLTLLEKWLPLLFTIIIIVILFFLKNKLSHKAKSNILTIMGLILFVSEIGARLLYFSYFGFSPNIISLHLCSISGIVGAYLLIFNRNRVLFGVWFFWALQGGLQALLTPTVTVGVYTLKYWFFYGTHMFLVITPFIMIYFMDYIPTFKDFKKSYLYLVILSIPVMLYNTVMGTNFMYISLSQDVRPITGSLLDILGPYPYYILILYGFVYISLLLTYLPFYLIYNRKEKLFS